MPGYPSGIAVKYVVGAEKIKKVESVKKENPQMEEKIPTIIPPVPMSKNCSNPDCKELQPVPLSEFDKNAAVKDGLTSICKACRRIYQKNRRKGLKPPKVEAVKIPIEVKSEIKPEKKPETKPVEKVKILTDLRPDCVQLLEAEREYHCGQVKRINLAIQILTQP
jgi:hypothetical protein